MKLKLTLPEGADEDDLDLTPMLDCVFLLVLFFMVTSSFIDDPERTLGFTITLPRADDPLKRPGDSIDTVTLTLAGDYFIRDGSTDTKIDSLDELLQILKERERMPSGRPLRFRCDALIEEGQELKAEEARALVITLPRADEASIIPRNQADSVIVTVEGALFFREAGGQPEAVKDVQTLQQRIEGRARPVILRCDARCPLQQFIQIKNVLKLAGVETIFEEVEVRHGASKP